MKEKLSNMWHDPVWSKVIAAVIVALGGLVVSAIKSLCSPMSFGSAVLNVLSFKVSVWVVLLVIFIVVLGVSLLKKYASKPTPPFVTEFTSGIYQNQRWQWNWRWDDEERRYHVYDLSVMCPKCKTGILTIYFDGYQCGKCGAEFDALGIDHEGVKRQILADARNAYPQFKDSVSDMWMV